MFRFLKILLISILFSFSVQAEESSKILAKHKKDFIKIEKYLQNIKNLTAKFIQESPDESIAVGKFYLSRPGKMRIEYITPTPLIITVNGSVLSYKDVELEETSYLRTNSTPASFLTRKNISFWAKDIEVTNFKKEDGLIYVSLVKKNKKEAGEFTLIFQNNPIKFVRMEVSDDLDQVTQVTLRNHDFKTKIDNKLFFVKNDQLP